MNDIRRVTTLSGISYALPVVTVMILMNTNNVLSGLYATHYGLSLAVISMVMLTANLFDAVTDPTIGYLSDRYHARTGSRRPFIVIGVLMLIPSAWFLLNPGEGVTWGYFLFWYLMFYLSFTLFQIPHLTWGGEISSITEEKNKAYAFRNYGLYGGMILFALVPMMPWTEGSRITPEVMRYLVLVAAILALPTLYMMLRHVPTGRVLDQPRMPENPFRAIAGLVHNKPLMWFYGVSLLVTVAQAFYVGVNFMAIDAYLGLGDYYVHLNLFHLVAGVLAIKPMMAVIARLGKMRAWRLSMVIAVFSYPILAFALLNNFLSLPLLFLFKFVYALSSALGNVAIFSLQSDISDYGTLKTGVDRSASCFAVIGFFGKSVFGSIIALSIALVGLFGFDPAASSEAAAAGIAQPHDSQAFWGMALSLGIIPTAMTLVAAFYAPRVAISDHRHHIIRRRLDARAARLDQNKLHGCA